MKFSVSSSELLGGLMSVSKVIVPKPTNSILENFLFQLKGNTLTVTASDGETTLRADIPIAQVTEEGSTAVPAKLLTDSLKEFPDQPLSFSVDAGSSVMDIVWASGASKIPCFDAADFPELPVIGEISESVIIPSAILLDGINNTIYATAEEELRPVMNGIFFDIDPEVTTLVASDAHKLICYSFLGAKLSQKSNFILHKKPASILKSILAKHDEDITIRYDNKNAYFSFGTNILVCRLIEGNYPAYRSVIPKNNNNKLVIGRTDLLGVVKRIAVCSNQISNQIRLKLSLGEVLISAQDLGFSMSAHETLPCQYDGQEMEIGFKAPFLLEILSNLPYQNICMELADPARAALIVSADEARPGQEIRALLMPVMINA
ncbi:MAG: DNA polymerase III subunit beta [Bacteroidales bacterium]|jgi:DNA polymerase-3 subunit beta|nr:DNA polymerase III subunit beta [Bacteroidales bacterium]